MTRPHSILGDRRGGAAVEMAIVTPVLVGLALISAEVWMMAVDKQSASNALDAAMDYYLAGGVSDSEAVGVAMDAWQDRPVDGGVTSARSGRCGAQTASINAVCSGGQAAAVYVTLIASATEDGIFDERPVEASRTVRVR